MTDSNDSQVSKAKKGNIITTGTFRANGCVYILLFSLVNPFVVSLLYNIMVMDSDYCVVPFRGFVCLGMYEVVLSVESSGQNITFSM